MAGHEQVTWEDTNSLYLFLIEPQEEGVLLTDPEKKSNIFLNSDARGTGGPGTCDCISITWSM